MLLLLSVVLVTSGIYYSGLQLIKYKVVVWVYCIMLNCFFFSESQSNDDCLDGFIDYNLLQQKASQIGVPNGYGDLSNKTLTSDYYILPTHKFTCPGTISGFLLGVEVRNDLSRDQFPSISLYSKYGGNNNYSPVDGSNRTISFGANMFSSSGVYEYNLSSNLQFSKDDILCVYQPPLDQSAVQLYYITENGSRLCRFTMSYKVMINQDECQEDRSLLLLPITSEPII